MIKSIAGKVVRKNGRMQQCSIMANEEVKEVTMSVRREKHARYLSRKTRLEEYAEARKGVEEIGQKKKKGGIGRCSSKMQTF